MSTECNRKTTRNSTPRRLFSRRRSTSRTMQLIDETVGSSEGRKSYMIFRAWARARSWPLSMVAILAPMAAHFFYGR